MDKKGPKDKLKKKCGEDVNLIDLDWRMPQENDTSKKKTVIPLANSTMPQTNAKNNELSELDKINELKSEMDNLRRWTQLELLNENGKIRDYLREQIVAKIVNLDDELPKLAKNCSKRFNKNEKKNDQMKMEIAKLQQQNNELKERIEQKDFEDGAQILPLNGKIEQEMKMLAKRVQKLETENLASKLASNFYDINGVEKEEIYRKWNARECGENLQIHSNLRKITHIGNENEWNTVRAELPILIDWRMHENKKQFIASYFEVHILEKANCNSHICIGYCGQKFPLEGVSICEKKIGSNYLGISCNDQIEINGVPTFFGSGDIIDNDFTKDDVLGCGLVGMLAERRLKCFSTCNGNLLGVAKLSPTFDEIPLFPALSMFDSKDCIEANFGQDAWLFDPINYKF